LDLAALGLGAPGDYAVAAQRGGRRAVRLTAVLSILQRRFLEPDFSAQKLAVAAGLLERYVNELLCEAGASFAARLNELRLREAAELLTMTRRPIGEIAFECGFNQTVLFRPQLPPPLRPDADRGPRNVTKLARRSRVTM
jgi:transcriptional regulator GlxA family with amidase domain